MSEQNSNSEQSTPEVNAVANTADAFFETSAQANQQRLALIAEEVNALQEQIVSNDSLAANHGRTALHCAYKAGIALNRAKRIVGDSGWMDWVTINIKGVSHRTVNRYMALATKIEPKYNRTTFDDLTSLREAYIRAGIIADKKGKSGDKKAKAPSPETVKDTNWGQYQASLNEARQTMQEKAQTHIERFRSRIDWNLSTWTIKNNKPCSDGPNQLACLFHTLAEWATLRGFESSLTAEDEMSTKAVIALNEVVKTILLANKPTAQIAPEVMGLKRLEGLNTAIDLNRPEPIEVAEATPALAPAA